MKVLKILLVLSVIVLVAVLAMTGYIYATAKVTVTGVSSSGMNAQNRSADFESLKSSLQENTFTGTVFQKPVEWKGMENYAYLTYTAEVSNQCFVPLNRVEIQVVSTSEDVVQLPPSAAVSLQPHSQGEVSATILTAADTNPEREIIVSWYVWGIPFSVHSSSGK